MNIVQADNLGYNYIELACNIAVEIIVIPPTAQGFSLNSGL
jgi:hypothetical protein